MSETTVRCTLTMFADKTLQKMAPPGLTFGKLTKCSREIRASMITHLHTMHFEKYLLDSTIFNPLFFNVDSIIAPLLVISHYPR